MKPFLAASDKRLRYEGRIDWSDTSKPVLIWQGTTVEIVFEGSELILHFGACRGVVCFDLEVDGMSTLVELAQANSPCEFRFPKALHAGAHRMVLLKRTEADVGHVVFQGISLQAGADVSMPPETESGLAMQFFGDSITAGACSEDGAVDQWETFATHNNARSYAALTAKVFGARYRNIAVSGMGVVVGYVPKVASEIWDRLYPVPDSPEAEEFDWNPNLVFVNYGENDDSFSRNQALDFPAAFADAYVRLVRNMRKKYPHAEFVLLRGGMFGGARSEALRQAWENAVALLKTTDLRLHSFVFNHWSDWHPRVSDHQAMAGELIAWLKTQPFMKRLG
ncbi:MAG: GDSL-type esterase/lipase family protein [Nibricoccus sp.]